MRNFSVLLGFVSSWNIFVSLCSAQLVFLVKSVL